MRIDDGDGNMMRLGCWWCLMIVVSVNKSFVGHALGVLDKAKTFLIDKLGHNEAHQSVYPSNAQKESCLFWQQRFLMLVRYLGRVYQTYGDATLAKLLSQPPTVNETTQHLLMRV